MAIWFFVLLMMFSGSTLRAGEETSVNKSANGLAYWVSGAGPTVVLIHGFSLDHRMWDSQVQILEPEYRVIRYDLRGHGKSDLPTEPYEASRDLLNLLDELEVEQVMLVGLSAGGQAAIDFALQHPNRVTRMLLAAPGVSGFRPAALPPFFQKLMQALQDGDYDLANQTLLDSPIMEVPPESRDFVASMVKSNGRLWTVPPNFVQTIDPPAISRLKDLKTPTLLLVGDRDVDYLRKLAEDVANQAPNARLEVITGGNHLLNLSSPEEFNSKMLGFLRGQ